MKSEHTLASFHRSAPLLITCMVLVAPAPAVADAIDGTYYGERVLTKGDPKTCVAKDPITVTISNGNLIFSDSRVKQYPMSFAPRPDGTFALLVDDGDGLTRAIRGRIADGVLDATVATANCEHHWHGQRYDERSR